MNKLDHFFTLMLGTGINVILGVITTPVITRLVSPDVYGSLSLFTLYANIFLIVATFGQDQAYNRFYYSCEEQGYKKYILKVTASAPIIISIISALIIVSYYFCDGKQNNILPIFAVYIISLVFEKFSGMTLRLQMNTKAYALFLNIQKLAYVVFVVLAINVTTIDHLLILAGSTVAAQIIACLLGVLAAKDVWSLKFFLTKTRDEYKKVIAEKELLKYGIPLVFTSLCVWIFTGADKVMIEMFSDIAELGIYASAVSVVGILSVVTSSFTVIWAPIAVEEYEKDNNNKTFFIKAADYTTIVLFIMGSCVILFKDVIVYFLGPEYREAVFLVPFLTLNPIMYTISESTVYGINFAKKTYLHIVIAGSCCIVNVALNYLLINAIGSLGAAISTGITYTLLFALRTFFSVKCFPVNYNIKKIVVLTIIYYIFAFYNSFYKIDLISCCIFIVFILAVIILYKKSIIEIFDMVKEYIFRLINRVK